MSEDSRISEIRAVVAEIDAIHPLDFKGIPSLGSVLDRIRAILDRPAPVPEPWQVEAHIQEQRATSLGYCEHVVETYPDGEEDTCSELRVRGKVHCAEHAPAPQVWFPGDTVPAGRTVQNVFGETVLLVDDIDCATATVVEIPVLTREEWQAAVDRAHRQRLDEATAQPHLGDGTTP